MQCFLLSCLPYHIHPFLRITLRALYLSSLNCNERETLGRRPQRLSRLQSLSLSPFPPLPSPLTPDP